MRCIAAWIGLLALSCATGPAARVDVDREFDLGAWRRAEMGGITLLTNASEGDASRVADRLVRFVALLKVALGFDPFPAGAGVRVFVFAERDQYVHYGGVVTDGISVVGEEGIWIGMSADSGFHTVPVLQQELTHAALHADARIGYPKWYHEGLAELLGTASFRENLVWLGAVPLGHGAVLARNEPLPLERILEVERPLDLEPLERVRFYADSWVLARFLHGSHGNGGSHQAELGTFLGRVGSGEEWRTAFDASFELSLAELETEFREFRDRAIRGGAPQVRVRLAGGLPRPGFEPVPARDVAWALAGYAEAIGRKDLALTFYEELVGLADDDADARRARSRVLAELRESDEQEQPVP